MAHRTSKWRIFCCAFGIGLQLSLLPTCALAASTTGVTTNQPKLSFAVISDIHLRAGRSDWGGAYRDLRAEYKFIHALKDLHQVNPRADALVVDGDMTTTGMQSDYTRLTQLLQGNPHPKQMLFAMGNHEYYSALRNQRNKLSLNTFPNGMTVQRCVQRFVKNTGMPNLYYDRWIRGYHFIVLAAIQPLSGKYKKFNNTAIPLTELEWLQKKLANTTADKPTFVFLHQPLPNTVVGSEKAYLVNGVKLHQILSHYPSVLFFSGHTHITFKGQPKSVVQDGFTMFNTSSVRNPITRAHKKLGKSEGIYVQVYDNEVIVKQRDFTSKKWLGQHVVHLDDRRIRILPELP